MNCRYAPLLTLVVFGIAVGQTTVPPGSQGVELLGGVLAPEIELPPRYRVEFILFAHNRFNEYEEHFDIVPSLSQFAAPDEAFVRRYFDQDSGQELRESIEGPISAPALLEPETALVDAAAAEPGMPPGADTTEPVLEEFLDPRMVEGPNTRYLELHELLLLPTLERLERLDAYMPLVHAGWEQNGLPEEEAVPLALGEFSSTNPRGTLRLHMSRYLHVLVDVAWQEGIMDTAVGQATEQPVTFSDFSLPQTAPTAALESPYDPYAELPFQVPEFYLFEERRILRGELNYFDHPAFGLLLHITLAPEPEEAPAETQDGPSA